MWAGAAVIEKCTPAAYLFRALASKFTLKQEKTKQNKKHRNNNELTTAGNHNDNPPR